MKNYLLLLIIPLLVLTGCVRHYYRKDNDTVRIFLEKPDAQQVYFLSSLDGYKPRKAVRLDERAWQISVPAQTEFKYFYTVDGKVYLPPCRLKELDDFGSQNCVYIPQLNGL